jgi:hypothetical protein
MMTSVPEHMWRQYGVLRRQSFLHQRLYLMRLWGQMLDPSRSLHFLLRRSCLHVCDPLHSLHRRLRRLWGQSPTALRKRKNS